MRHFLDLAKSRDADGDLLAGDSLPTWHLDHHCIEWPAGEGARAIYLPIEGLPVPLVEATNASRSAALYLRLAMGGATDTIIPTVVLGTQAFAISGTVTVTLLNDLEEGISAAAATYMARALGIAANGGTSVALCSAIKLTPGPNPHDAVRLLAAWVAVA